MARSKGKPRYRGRSQWKKGGYRSGLEKDIADDLTTRGIAFEYESVRLEYKRRVAKGVCDACGAGKTSQRRTYTPDFVIGNLYIEAKGRFAASDRAKILAVKTANPGCDIRLVFAQDNKVEKNKNERYSDWASKHSIPYTVGRSVPDDWCGEEVRQRKESGVAGAGAILPARAKRNRKGK